MPHHRKAKEEGLRRNIDAHASIFRQFDLSIVRQMRLSLFLHRPKGVSIGDVRNGGKIVKRRRRRSGPFKRTAIPGIAGRVFPSLFEAVEDLVHLHADGTNDDHKPNHRDDEKRLPSSGRIVVIESARSAHESQEIEWHERDVKSNQPQPKGDFAQTLIQKNAGHFGKPKTKSGKNAKERAANDLRVEMRDEKEAVVQLKIDRWSREQNACHPAQDECAAKSNEPIKGRG